MINVRKGDVVQIVIIKDGVHHLVEGTVTQFQPGQQPDWFRGEMQSFTGFNYRFDVRNLTGVRARLDVGTIVEERLENKPTVFHEIIEVVDEKTIRLKDGLTLVRRASGWKSTDSIARYTSERWDPRQFVIPLKMLPVDWK